MATTHRSCLFCLIAAVAFCLTSCSDEVEPKGEDLGDTGQTETGSEDITQEEPDLDEPDLVEPDLDEPDTVEPDLAEPDLVEIDTSDIPVGVDCDNPVELGADITTDTMLPVACYRLTNRVMVTAALTVQPGTIFQGVSGSGLRIAAEGSLSAEGTADDPILFTSASGNRNDWYGVGIASASEDNLLDHVLIENAGRPYSTINNSRLTNLYLANNAQVAITNSTFRNAGGATDNTGYGIYTETNSIFTAFEDNSFDGNGAAVMRITSQQLGMIGEGNSFTGDNTLTSALFVEVDIATLTTSATWRAIDVPYRFLGRNYIDDAGATITIQPGTILEFDSASGLRLNAGTLVAAGTDVDPITFTSASGNRKDWYGIGIASASEDNLLDHVIIENAGQTYSTINNSRSTNLYIANNAQVAITNSTFRNAGGATDNTGYGIYTETNTILTTFEDNSFDGNGAAVMRITAQQLGMIGQGNSFAGASTPANALFVEVDIATLTTSATWRAIDVPYRFLGRNYIDDGGATITIQPGTILEFDSASGLRLNAGTLRAPGTGDDPITFTSASGNSNDWYGIGIASGSANNLLDHVLIENAGQTYSTINNSRSTNLYVGTSGRIAVTNSAFDNSGGWGIYNQGTITDQAGDTIDPATQGNNSFDNNTSGAVGP